MSEAPPVPSGGVRRPVLFYRDFRAFSGGHLKVFHYWRHVRASPLHEARISFSAESVWDRSNPWLPYRHEAVLWEPAGTTILFLAGMDWTHAAQRGLEGFDGPIVNLIQHVRHADPAQPLHAFLSRKAVRICVSPEVEAAIAATGRVRGPIVTIPDAIEEPAVDERHWPVRRDGAPVLVVATKRTEYGRSLAGALEAGGIATRLHDRFVPRAEFLDLLGRHALTLFCPDETEGFYLPALEAMAAGSFVVCPDCVGNRSFCIDGETAYRPPYEPPATIEAVVRALRLPAAEFDRIRRNAAEQVRRHSLACERDTFLDLLARIDALWAG